MFLFCVLVGKVQGMRLFGNTQTALQAVFPAMNVRIQNTTVVGPPALGISGTQTQQQQQQIGVQWQLTNP